MTVYEVFSTTLEGTVQEFKYINPHSIIVLKVAGPKGATVWHLEGDPPATLDRDGYSRTTFRPGDKLKLSINRLRSGQNGGLWTVRTAPGRDTYAAPELWSNFADFYRQAAAASQVAFKASRAKGEAEFRKTIAGLRTACDSCHALYLKTEP